MIFIRTKGSHRSGFYRNIESAKAEAETIRQNAANGPRRPRESAGAVRDRMDEALRAQGVLQKA